ncbi:MAG: hypothetical protein PHS45_04465 [Bacilli bacterium]|nr:hypothetical protein [Bacilli bacterium]
MSSENNKKRVIISFSFNFTRVLGLLFIGLKLGRVIDWSWLWVLSPLWAPAGAVISALAVIGSVIGIKKIVELVGDKISFEIFFIKLKKQWKEQEKQDFIESQIHQQETYSYFKVHTAPKTIEELISKADEVIPSHYSCDSIRKEIVEKLKGTKAGIKKICYRMKGNSQEAHNPVTGYVLVKGPKFMPVKGPKIVPKDAPMIFKDVEELVLNAPELSFTNARFDLLHMLRQVRSGIERVYYNKDYIKQIKAEKSQQGKGSPQKRIKPIS